MYPITFASQSFPVHPPLIPDAHVSPHPQQIRKKKSPVCVIYVLTEARTNFQQPAPLIGLSPFPPATNRKPSGVERDTSAHSLLLWEAGLGWR